MLGPVHRRTLDRAKRVSFLKRDHEGVASTVGTIMALMVFLVFLTMITNSYVPGWMQDNERDHMNRVIDQFGELKGKVDSMVVQQQVDGGNSIQMYAPISLGSAGVPLFATPTVGLLSYVPQGISSTGVHVTFNYSVQGSSNPVSVDVTGGGKVDLYVPNRYYVQQWVGYENGAIIVKQPDGQAVRAFPSLELTKTQGANSVINIGFTQVDLIGVNASVSGSDSVGINLDLIYIDAQTYTLAGDQKWTLSLTTSYGVAWTKYLSDTLTKAGLTNNTDYKLTSSLPNQDGISKIDLTINNAGTLNYNRAFVSMTVLTN